MYKIQSALNALIISLLASYTYSQKIDSTYLLYPKKFEYLGEMRGIPISETAELLEEFKSNNVKSNVDFAKLLLRFYFPNKNIAIILFSYDNNILNRVLFEPGRVIEGKEILMSSEALSLINTKIVKALNINSLAYDRLPKYRGVTVLYDSTKIEQNIDEVIDEATSILLPKNFSKKYKNLIIIPCLNIGSFPFQVLKPYSDGSYLIDNCSITVAPTLLDFVYLT